MPLELARPEDAFDLVLVDAPCSGTGTWRRQPELRWRLTEGRLAELTAIQDRLLDRAAGLVAPGGRLVYATCSILPAENQDRTQAFRARQPGFTALDLRDSWPNGGTLPPPGLGDDFRASPGQTGTDGFYCAGFRRA
jgi:16S rRNA (cytosine967-C5)-methyltransferase